MFPDGEGRNMTMAWREQSRPDLALREIVQQATDALVRMNADRIQELARCCADLNRDLNEMTGWDDQNANAGVYQRRRQFRDDLLKIKPEMDVLGEVLKETRANLSVFTRLQDIELMSTERSSSDAYLAACKLPGGKAEYGDN